MSLAVSSGSEVTLIADGSDEQDALAALTAYVQEKKLNLYEVWLFLIDSKRKENNR